MNYMKRTITFLFLFVLSTTTIMPASENKTGSINEQTENTSHEYLNDTDKEVISIFSKILIHFASIIQAPYNPAVLGPNLIGIAAGIINVAMQTLKTTKSPMNLDQETIEQLRLIQKQLHTLCCDNLQA